MLTHRGEGVEAAEEEVAAATVAVVVVVTAMGAAILTHASPTAMEIQHASMGAGGLVQPSPLPLFLW